jgi:hypothetical protein
VDTFPNIRMWIIKPLDLIITAHKFSSGAHDMECLPGQASDRPQIKSQLILKDIYQKVSFFLSQLDKIENQLAEIKLEISYIFEN